MEEVTEFIETPAMLAFRLKDLVQQYHNMLTCIHDLKPEERAQLETWLAETNTKIKDLTPHQDA